MKSFFGKVALAVTGALVVLCYSCDSGEQAATEILGEPIVVEVKPAETKPVETKPIETKAVAVEEKPKVQAVVVAEIGDYGITRDELEQQLIGELRSQAEDEAGPDAAKQVLLKMIAEKAMITEGRKQDLLADDSFIKRFRTERLVGLLLGTHLRDKIKVTDPEIDEKMKANPKWDRARAKTMLEREKSRVLGDEFYNELHKKLGVRKVRDNFGKAAQIHNRLLYRPQAERKGYWIKNQQIKDELTAEEKGIVLASFEGGAITLLDWFGTLNEMSPPSRPKDLGTVKGVERLLDRTMRMPIFVAEAKRQGLDKDENYVKGVREREDQSLLNKVRRKVYEGLEEPTKEAISDYFNKHKEEFGSSDTLKIDQIWCQDFKTAEKVKDELNSGRDFESVKQEYSLRKKESALNAAANRDGVFFKDLWAGEPNEIVGPVKGFYREGDRRRIKWLVKWRMVKILEKKPGRMREYSSGVEREVKSRMRNDQREAAVAKYSKELLEKYPYKIYSERMKDIEPLDVP